MFSKEVKKWLTDCKELDPVCDQLYEFYRSKDTRLKQFSLQFASALIWLYLRCLSQGDKKICGGVETFLLGVYNLEIIKFDGTPVVESICIPSINKTSVYHESRPSWLAEPLTERALHALSPMNSMFRSGPFPQYERFNAQNRFSILSYVMHHYNNNIDSFHAHSLEILCKVTIMLSNAGFKMLHESGYSHQPRISVNQTVLLELLFAVNFALFNGHQEIAVEAVQAVHKRSSFELYSDVLLVTNAILSSCSRGNLQFDTGHISLGAQKTALVLKNSLTNASFRAKKLPDDIDIVEEVQRRLPAIIEDQEYSMAKGLKSRLMTLGGKFGVDKSKSRDAVRQYSDTGSPKMGSPGEFVDSGSKAIQSPSSSGVGKGVVDMLESQQQRNKGNGNWNDSSGIDGIHSNGKINKDGKHIRVSPSTIIFSKKSGILRQAPHGTSGLVTKNSESSSKTSHTFTTSSPSTLPPTVSSFPSTASLNVKATSGTSNSTSNNVMSNIQQSVRVNRNKSSEVPHGTLTRSEDATQNESRSTSAKSYTSLLSSSTHSFPSNRDTSSQSSSESLLAHHSSNSQSQTSAKSNSMSTESSLINRKRPSKKSHVNKDSFSTDL